MQAHADYKLLLSPMFSAMTKITDHLFLTGVGGMTHENLRKNHIDFIVNITTEAPMWEGLDSMRLPLEDDSSTNILAHFDVAVDRIHEAITKRNAHVLVHCVAGVSRSAAIVIAYLMKVRRMDLHGAFGYCYSLRPVIRPNNGFMIQLINYEQQLFGKTSVNMVEVDVDGTLAVVPNFFVNEYPGLVELEVYRVRDQERQASQQPKPASQPQPQPQQVQSNIQSSIQSQPSSQLRSHPSSQAHSHHTSQTMSPTTSQIQSQTNSPKLTNKPHRSKSPKIHEPKHKKRDSTQN